ncbi:hypothetical protein JS756_33745 [Streptomyces actuosus]|uniref:Integral membrane protein n=1 Tax=Streptomyces actuosus TaxID=1885 RepID=A0ABS2W0M9_STRAS|nr:streptophobe family protein [Streptomyces actuosus]MBN0048962.1 hypothetical protein [Streptomyces actuosus]
MGFTRGWATTRHGARPPGRTVPWGDVVLSAVAAVSWALIGMAGTAALGLHLLRADEAGALGRMTAAVVALGAGGSVTPSGDVSAFGLTGAQADTAIEITPLGVSLVGALLLSWFFLRSLRTAGVAVTPAELLARAGSVLVVSAVMFAGLAWAGHDVVTIDGGSLGLDDLPGIGGGGGGGGIDIPGLGDIGGLLPDRIGDLIDAKASVGFTVDTVPTLLGGLAWTAGVLVVALLASRRTPLPRGLEFAHAVVRPAVSALVTVLVVAVAAGLAAAGYAAIGDDHPARIAGAALLGAPDGVWLGVAIGLFVPWDGRATGELAKLLPDPLDDLLTVHADRPVTLARLADLDGRVWLLGVAAALMMLLAGVLTAVRTPLPSASREHGREGAGRRVGFLGFAGRCALRLGVASAVALPLLVRLTEVSVNASLSVLGFDAFGAGIELHGRPGPAVLLGAVWGAGAGAVGALLTCASGAAGRRAAPLARSDAATAPGGTEAAPYPAAGAHGAAGGPYGTGAGPRDARSGPYPPGPGTPGPGGGPGAAPAGGSSARGSGTGPARGGRGPAPEARPGPYAPGTPYRPPNPDTNPYLRVPDEVRAPQDGGGSGGGSGEAAGGNPAGGDVYGAPTMARPVGPPPPAPGPRPGGRRGEAPRGDDGPPPPPPPPPPPARRPKGPR